MSGTDTTASDSREPAKDPAVVQLARSLSSSFALHVGVRVIEALSIGWLAGALVAASAAVTMRSSLSVQAWIAAGLCAACAAASTWMQHPPRRDEHVRDADHELALDGALVTSAGIMPSSHTGSLGAALVRRVSERLQSGELLRAALPRTPLALLAALAGAAVLFAAQDAGRRFVASSPADGRTVSEALESAAQAVRSAALDQQAVRSAALDPQDARANGASKAALSAIANDLERAARKSADAASEATADAASEAERLQRAIEAAQSANPAPSTARALEKARSAVESARSASARAAGAGSVGVPDRGTASSKAKGAKPTPGDPGSTSPSPDGSSRALASAAADGRMSARNAGPRASTSPGATGSTSAAPERGVGATRWWPPAYDAIVESWLAGDAPGH